LKRKSQTKSLELFGPRTAGPLIDPEATWTAKLRDEISPRGILGLFRIIIQSNVAGRDLGSVINEVRAAISQKVALPQGYFVQYGGQFEAQDKGSRHIPLLSIIAVGGIFLLL